MCTLKDGNNLFLCFHSDGQYNGKYVKNVNRSIGIIKTSMKIVLQ